MKFFRAYQFIAPLLLLPLSYWLWWQRYSGDHRLVGLTLSLPIIFAYVIPGIGTNWLRLWEFNSRFKWGRFRPHHGLVFGAATSMLALFTLPLPGEQSIAEMFRSGFVLGSVLAFWNWLYDTYAIQVGFVEVYTRTSSRGADSATIAMDYAPVLFGVFGLCYGISIRSVEHILLLRDRWEWMWQLLLACHFVCLVVPVLTYVLVSYIRTGETGLRSYERVGHDG